MALKAVREARAGQIQIIAFDEDDETLQGIIDGDIYGTVVQNPYRYGYESVRIPAALVPRGDRSAPPPNNYLKDVLAAAHHQRQRQRVLERTKNAHWQRSIMQLLQARGIGKILSRRAPRYTR